jgi:hypothetical protein
MCCADPDSGVARLACLADIAPLLPLCMSTVRYDP